MIPRIVTFLAALTLECGAAEKPNVLFILVDDLGIGDLSSHGATDMRTPHIDALMEAGVRFENGYANCPVCSPTRASLLTGLYPDRAGVPGVIRTHPEDSWGYLDPMAKTLPQVLKPAGYHCAIIGKWHLGLEAPNTPITRGFDHFHGYLGDMMDDYRTHRRHGINYMRQDGKEIDPEGHATDLFTAWAIDYLRERAAKPEKPWFLYLAYNAPHTPIQPPADWLEKVKEREPGIPEKRAKLVALIEHLDEGIGKVLAQLHEGGMGKNTLIVFTSDNGGQVDVGASNGRYRGAKQDMFEGGIRVPTCAVWPGKIASASRTDVIALTMDWFPTLCEIAGAEAPAGIDGVSLAGLLTGGAAPVVGRTLVWVRREGGAKYGGKDYHAIRRGPWKLEQNSPFEPMVLYNVAVDPEEKRPVESESTVRRELEAALRSHIQRAGIVPWQRPE
jgi:arylsulfatase A-like enzyme